ncbi:MAG: carboxypeptidase regulatory-like domain-containing protein, partial [Chlorobiales bacterium]|nr:carboxypeptidase regulatory-like domain-containing protein [Chlorobiales bacterium]
MPIRKTTIIAASFLLFVVLPLVAMAQGRLVGKVTDQNNAPVVAAVVAISSQELNEAAITNASGYYVFYSLPPGDYKVKVVKRGLPSIQSGAAVTTGTTRLLDIKLTPQPSQKEVVVAVEAPKKVPEKRKAEPQPIK